MTDRIVALTVTLDDVTRVDDAEPVMQAIQMIRGVQSVLPVEADANVYWAREAARRELERDLSEMLRPSKR